MKQRTKYRIDFDTNQWFFVAKDKIPDAVKELKPKSCQIFEVTEVLDSTGKVLNTSEKPINEEELK